MKKGFSLIELVIVISLISTISFSSFLGIANYFRFSNEMDALMSETMVIALINNGKQFCREKEKPGYILFDRVRNEVNFFSSSKRIDGYKLPKGINLYSINTYQSKIDINKFGVASDAGTIILKDKQGKLHTITVSVGTGYAEVK